MVETHEDGEEDLADITEWIDFAGGKKRKLEERFLEEGVRMNVSVEEE